MNQALAPIAPLDASPADLKAGLASAAAEPSGRFGLWFTQQLDEVNTKMVQAEQGLKQLAAGDASNLHDVMIRMEEARLSLQLAVQVRARALEAYQDVMRMQV